MGLGSGKRKVGFIKRDITWKSSHVNHLMMMMFITITARDSSSEGETENMCVWTKKRGSLNAVVLMATPCPKSLHGKGEKLIARISQGLDSRQPMTAMTEKKSPG